MHSEEESVGPTHRPQKGPTFPGIFEVAHAIVS